MVWVVTVTVVGRGEEEEEAKVVAVAVGVVDREVVMGVGSNSNNRITNITTKADSECRKGACSATGPTQTMDTTYDIRAPKMKQRGPHVKKWVSRR